MNCREAQSQVFAERDGALDTLQRAALDSHVAQCASCRQIRADLAAVFVAWRDTAQNVRVPDAEREWHAVRRRIRRGVSAGESVTFRPRRRLLPWIMAPIGAVAAAAVAFFMVPQGRETLPPTHTAPHVARADSVEAPGNNASTMVYVDDKSGWLFVMANDSATPKRG